MIPQIEVCSATNFIEVQNYIRQFELDDRNIHKEEFLTLSINSKLLAFGRIREHQNVSEMCTLGVIEQERTKGFGKALVSALIQKATQPIYLVCVIPTYFESLGFYICEEYPDVIRDKINYCSDSLCVQEKYVAMTNQKNPLSI